MLKRKKIISLMLVLLMIFSIIPLYGFGEIQTEGAETQISTEAESSEAESSEAESQTEESETKSDVESESSTNKETSSNEESTSANDATSDESNSSKPADSPISRSGTNKLVISWVDSTSNGTVNGDLLTNVPDENTKQYAVVQVDFQLAEGTSAAAGEVEIRIPYSIIDDDSLSEVSIAGAEDFEWYYDSVNGEIVLTNKTAIDSSKAYVMQVAYAYLPTDVVADQEVNGTSSSYINSFDADLYISGIKVQDSNDLNIKVTTKINTYRATKNFYQKYELWQSEWGTSSVSNTTDYFYLEWKIQDIGQSYATQSYTISMEDLIPQEYLDAGAYVVGYRYGSSSASFVAGDSYTAGTGTVWYVIIAYPRSLYESTGATSINITNTTSSEVTGKYGTYYKTNEATAAYNYSTLNFQYSGDLYSIFKTSGSVSGVGVINQLLDDETVALSYANYSYTITATSQGYGETYGLLDSGEYGYGAKEYTTNLVDDLVYLEGEQLVADDYSIDSFYMSSFDEYDAYENASSGKLEGNLSADYTSYSPIEVWYQTGGDGGIWTLLGTIEKTGASTYTFTPDGGTAQTLSSTSQVALPSGTTGIKFVHSTNRYKVSYAPRIKISLYPTNHVKQLLEGKTSAVLYNVDSLIVQDSNGIIVSSGDSYLPSGTLNPAVDERDVTIYGQEVLHNRSGLSLTKLSGYSSISKAASTPVNDGDNPQAKVTYTITAYDTITSNSSFDWDDLKNLGLISPQNEGTFYDLLPVGAYADTSSILVKTYRNVSGNTGTICNIDSVETVDNWQGSGQTMLIIKVSYPNAGSQDNYYYTSGNYDSYYTGFKLTYDLYYPWDSIADYGNTLLNTVAYRAAEGELIDGKTAAESTIKNNAYYANLTDSTGSLPNDDTNKNTIYVENTVSVNLITSTNTGFSKRVNSSEYPSYESTTTVYTGDTYNYQLRYRTANNATAKNLIFYDVFEVNYGSNAYWKGTLVGVDTTYIESNYPNADVKVYYSTVSGLDQNDTDPLSNTAAAWTTSPTNLSDVTAIVVDITLNKDGSVFELPASSTVLCNVTMAAPGDYSVDQAYNKAKCYGTLSPTTGNETSIDFASATEVNLLAKTDFEFTKVDAADEQVLADAEFALYEWTDTTADPSDTDLVDQSALGSWSLVGTATSDGNGLVTFTGLTEGTYQLVETKAPTDYVTPSGQWRIEVDSTGAITITAVDGSSTPPAFSGSGTAASPYQLGNNKNYVLPLMGGNGLGYIITIIGLLFVGAGLYLFTAKGKKI